MSCVGFVELDLLNSNRLIRVFGQALLDWSCLIGAFSFELMDSIIVLERLDQSKWIGDV